MSFKINPSHPTETRELTPKQIDEILFLLCPYSAAPLLYKFDKFPAYMEDGYKYYIPFGYKDCTFDDEKDYKFHGFCGFMRSDDDDNDFFYAVPSNCNVYCTANGFKKVLRKECDLLSIQNLVIDIDCHDDAVSIDALNAHIDLIEPKLLELLPIKPNFVHHTGRGLHLWYCIEPCHVSLKGFCLSAISMLSQLVSRALRTLDEKLLEIDTGASANLVGFYRVPYTYNCSAGRWSTGKLLHIKRPNIVKLCNSLYRHGVNCYDYLPKKDRKVVPLDVKNALHYKRICAKYRIKYWNDYTPALVYRRRVLE